MNYIQLIFYVTYFCGFTAARGHVFHAEIYLFHLHFISILFWKILSSHLVVGWSCFGLHNSRTGVSIVKLVYIAYYLLFDVGVEPLCQAFTEIRLGGLYGFFHHITCVFVGWEIIDFWQECLENFMSLLFAFCNNVLHHIVTKLALRKWYWLLQQSW